MHLHVHYFSIIVNLNSKIYNHSNVLPSDLLFIIYVVLILFDIYRGFYILPSNIILRKYFGCEVESDKEKSTRV